MQARSRPRACVTVLVLDLVGRNGVLLSNSFLLNTRALQSFFVSALLFFDRGALGLVFCFLCASDRHWSAVGHLPNQGFEGFMCKQFLLVLHLVSFSENPREEISLCRSPSPPIFVFFHPSPCSARRFSECSSEPCRRRSLHPAPRWRERQRTRRGAAAVPHVRGPSVHYPRGDGDPGRAIARCGSERNPAVGDYATSHRRPARSPAVVEVRLLLSSC